MTLTGATYDFLLLIHCKLVPSWRYSEISVEKQIISHPIFGIPIDEGHTVGILQPAAQPPGGRVGRVPLRF